MDLEYLREIFDIRYGKKYYNNKANTKVRIEIVKISKDIWL